MNMNYNPNLDRIEADFRQLARIVMDSQLIGLNKSDFTERLISESKKFGKTPDIFKFKSLYSELFSIMNTIVLNNVSAWLNDFYGHDCFILMQQEPNTKFVWGLHRSGTHIHIIDEKTHHEDIERLIHNNSVFYYYNGTKLDSINKMELLDLANSYKTIKESEEVEKEAEELAKKDTRTINIHEHISQEDFYLIKTMKWFEETTDINTFETWIRENITEELEELKTERLNDMYIPLSEKDLTIVVEIDCDTPFWKRADIVKVIMVALDNDYGIFKEHPNIDIRQS